MSRQSSRSRYREYREQRRAPNRPRSGRPVAEIDAESPGKESAREPRTFSQLLRELIGLLRGQWNMIAFAMGTLTVATLLKLVPPAATKLVIDCVLDDHPLPAVLRRWFLLPDDHLQRLLWITAAAAAVSLLATFLRLWGRWVATKAVNHVRVLVRRRVFDHAIRLPLHRIYSLKSGGAASLLREDAGGVADLVFSMLYNPWQAIIQFVGSLVVLIWVDWRLMLGGLVLLPVVYTTHRTWISRIRPLYRDIRARRQEVDSHATEAFGGIRIVRAFGRQRSEAARFVRGNHMLVRQQLHAWWWARIIEIIWDVLLPLASTGLLLYGGYRVLQGQLTLGDLTMFLVYLAMLLSPLATLATSATAFQNSLAGLDRVLDLLDEPQEIPPAPNALMLRPKEVAGRITLEDVSFHYPATQRMVLSDLRLDVAPGETVALVGRSGAGKTTLCNLVARFYDPTYGTVRLDGRDLKTLQLDSYRHLLGIVEQDIFLFDGTVRENIGYGNRRADSDQIEAASVAAGADDFIVELHAGYDTVVGERGVKLSGGQRQRLAIARAVLADPKILILDEATSNLDSESERQIQQSLARLMEGRTCFVIAHRLSTVQHADRIVVLRAGQIVECGTHDALMDRCGHYRRMIDLQIGVRGIV
ncbi:MAG: ABC transporter ATP-binding protein [Pirellulales bacterium]